MAIPSITPPKKLCDTPEEMDEILWQMFLNSKPESRPMPPKFRTPSMQLPNITAVPTPPPTFQPAWGSGPVMEIKQVTTSSPERTLPLKEETPTTAIGCSPASMPYTLSHYADAAIGDKADFLIWLKLKDLYQYLHDVSAFPKSTLTHEEKESLSQCRLLLIPVIDRLNRSLQLGKLYQ